VLGGAKRAALNTPLPTGGTLGMALDSAMPFVDFAKDPNLMTGGIAAVAIPTRGRSGAFARLLRAANEEQLVGSPSLMKALGQLPELTGKARPGRAYRVPVDTPEGYRMSALPGELERTVAVQDPRTGSIFVGQGVHHDHLIRALERRGIGPQGGKWLQHDFMPHDAQLDVPARMNQLLGVLDPEDAWRGSAGDTRKATLARMRLLRALQKKSGPLAPASYFNP
jgi:hypothetical protein